MGNQTNRGMSLGVRKESGEEMGQVQVGGCLCHRCLGGLVEAWRVDRAGCSCWRAAVNWVGEWAGKWMGWLDWQRSQ